VFFRETKLPGAFVIELQKHEDGRGFFARSWCQKEFEARGLNPRTVQCNLSFNKLKGTLRGMHYQVVPCAEAKLVRCTRGAIYDVIIDLRRESVTYKQHVSEVLSSDNYKALFIPEGFAHGFVVLSAFAEFLYKTTDYWFPEYERCIAWNDSASNIDWPINTAPILSVKDATGVNLIEAEVFA